MTEGEFDAGYWEQRYRDGEGAGRAEPGPALPAEVAGLRPGRALDAGCGRGADARWLAGRGWEVTAVDVSATALAQAQEDEPAVRWVQGDLLTWEPGERFDLVTSSYVHVPGPVGALVARLASWVAPGGTLLVVGHDASRHAHPGAGTSVEELTAALSADAWQVLVAEVRPHEVAGVTRHDVVVRARRTGPQDPSYQSRDDRSGDRSDAGGQRPVRRPRPG